MQEILGDIPRHGYRGELFPEAGSENLHRWALCLSREFGARGGTIARQLAKKLGWQIYEREMLEYMARTPAVFEELQQLAGPQAREWADSQWDLLKGEKLVVQEGEIGELARVILLVSYLGNIIFVGGGAGFLLPPANRVHVRIISSFEERAAYVCQYDRLTQAEAGLKVRRMDEKRDGFLISHFPLMKDPVHCFDLIINSETLGLETCLNSLHNLMQAKMGKVRKG